VLGEKGIPLKVIEYLAVPPFTEVPEGTVKSIQRVASFPGRGGDGEKPWDLIVKTVCPIPQSAMVEDDNRSIRGIKNGRNILTDRLERLNGSQFLLLGMSSVPVFSRGQWITYKGNEDPMWSYAHQLQAASVYATALSKGYKPEESEELAVAFVNKTVYKGVVYMKPLEEKLMDLWETS